MLSYVHVTVILLIIIINIVLEFKSYLFKVKNSRLI